MNIIDLRNKLQQSSTERRISSDNRKMSYQFGSPEWLERMKNKELKYLEEERRKIIRRSEAVCAFSCWTNRFLYFNDRCKAVCVLWLCSS